MPRRRIGVDRRAIALCTLLSHPRSTCSRSCSSARASMRRSSWATTPRDIAICRSAGRTSLGSIFLMWPMFASIEGLRQFHSTHHELADLPTTAAAHPVHHDAAGRARARWGSEDACGVSRWCCCAAPRPPRHVLDRQGRHWLVAHPLARLDGRGALCTRGRRRADHDLRRLVRLPALSIMPFAPGNRHRVCAARSRHSAVESEEEEYAIPAPPSRPSSNRSSSCRAMSRPHQHDGDPSVVRSPACPAPGADEARRFRRHAVVHALRPPLSRCVSLRAAGSR